MISIFVGEGRLGNQVFQYVAMRRLNGRGLIWTTGLQSLNQVFLPPSDIRHVFRSKNVERAIRRVFVPIFMRPMFRWMHIGRYCYEPTETFANGASGMGGRAAVSNGLLPLMFFDGGYYQNLTDLLSPADFKCLKLRPDVLAEARSVLGRAIFGRAAPRAVMHVRRGDYIGFRTYGLESVLLPVGYYKRAAAAAREYLGPESEILVITDDAAWCVRELVALKPFTVVSGPETVDFALLSMFPVAILSNSTFSLAAACVGPTVERVIGPEYWFGHSVRQWYPPRIRALDGRFVYV